MTSGLSRAQIGADSVTLSREGYVGMTPLGKGQFGRVYKAYNRSKQEVAVKIVPRDKFSGDEVYACATLQKQHCPYIAGYFGSKQIDDEIIIEIEYCNSGSLHDLTKNGQYLGESDARRLLKQILIGVKTIHSCKFIHRDIKPENILLHCPKRTTTIIHDSIIKITDFGLSRSLNASEMAKTQCGTPLFMAPEVFLEEGRYSNKADMWSVGVILYNLLSGRLPFPATSSVQLMRLLHAPFPRLSHVSSDCHSLISALLCTNPARRISAVDALEHRWFNTANTESCPPPRPSRPLSTNLDRGYRGQAVHIHNGYPEKHRRASNSPHAKREEVEQQRPGSLPPTESRERRLERQTSRERERERIEKEREKQQSKQHSRHRDDDHSEKSRPSRRKHTHNNHNALFFRDFDRRPHHRQEPPPSSPPRQTTPKMYGLGAITPLTQTPNGYHLLGIGKNIASLTQTTEEEQSQFINNVLAESVGSLADTTPEPKDQSDSKPPTQNTTPTDNQLSLYQLKPNALATPPRAQFTNPPTFPQTPPRQQGPSALFHQPPSAFSTPTRVYEGSTIDLGVQALAPSHNRYRSGNFVPVPDFPDVNKDISARFHFDVQLGDSKKNGPSDNDGPSPATAIHERLHQLFNIPGNPASKAIPAKPVTPLIKRQAHHQVQPDFVQIPIQSLPLRPPSSPSSSSSNPADSAPPSPLRISPAVSPVLDTSQSLSPPPLSDSGPLSDTELETQNRRREERKRGRSQRHGHSAPLQLEHDKVHIIRLPSQHSPDPTALSPEPSPPSPNQAPVSPKPEPTPMSPPEEAEALTPPTITLRVFPNGDHLLQIPDTHFLVFAENADIALSILNTRMSSETWTWSSELELGLQKMAISMFLEQALVRNIREHIHDLKHFVRDSERSEAVERFSFDGEELDPNQARRWNRFLSQERKNLSGILKQMNKDGTLLVRSATSAGDTKPIEAVLQSADVPIVSGIVFLFTEAVRYAPFHLPIAEAAASVDNQISQRMGAGLRNDECWALLAERGRRDYPTATHDLLQTELRHSFNIASDQQRFRASVVLEGYLLLCLLMEEPELDETITFVVNSTPTPSHAVIRLTQNIVREYTLRARDLIFTMLYLDTE
ncbi:putative Serine/threonine-protein kinase H1 like protein [Blattamonas nauphoetae]|uniref:Serine/threonine-protein kinase H1 like protein n=1 Tax=Blattamonas nauphoetae TaxID=2049346 RepID=A0ABQ9XMX5_9EUKA|nr:putative Serine/threonine-protein kinase H1 like protein [Blattamonas nauphoetae]